MDIRDLISRIETQTGKQAIKTGDGYNLCCPCHDDKQASLHISERLTADGGILIKCFAECNTGDIMASLGLSLKDLFNSETKKNTHVTFYHYYDPITGEYVYSRERVNPKNFFNGKFINGKFVYSSSKTGSKLTLKVGELSALYFGDSGDNAPTAESKNLNNIKAVLNSDKPFPLFIVEGEKDVNTVLNLKLPCITTGNCESWNDSKTGLNAFFGGVSPFIKFVIIADNDKQGYNFACNTAERLRKLLPDNEIVILCPTVGERKGTDITDYLTGSCGVKPHSKEDLLNLVKSGSNIDQLKVQLETVTPTAESNPEPKKGKTDLTINELQNYLRDNNISIRSNDITHDIEIDGRFTYIGSDGSEYAENADHLQKNITTLLSDQLRNKHYTRASIGVDSIGRMLEVIADRESYNPVLEMITAENWDGVDRLPIIYNVLGIDKPYEGETITGEYISQGEEDIKLSQVLVKKWLLQAVALLKNSTRSPFGADGVLILQGSQGIGKSSFFKALCSFDYSLFKGGVSLNFNDKDSLIRSTSGFITELGEFERSMSEANRENMKAFITQDVDELRTPYAKKAEKTPRRASMCGTCNTSDFLKDSTGNRRFWIVQLINPIEWQNLKKDDVIQLFRQCYAEVIDGDGNVKQDVFRLNKNERDALEARNSKHMSAITGEITIRDILDSFPIEKFKWEYQTISEFQNLYGEQLSRYKAEQIGRALTKLGYGTNRKKVNGSVKRVAYLPIKELSYQYIGNGRPEVAEVTDLPDIMEI